MDTIVYVTLSGEDRIQSYTLDGNGGKLALGDSFAIEGGPGPMATSPDFSCVYVGLRKRPGVATFLRDRMAGSLSLKSFVSFDEDPCFIGTDRSGTFLLSSCYGGGRVGVHRIAEDGTVSLPPIEWRKTATNAHSIQTDSTNRFAFVPHTGPNVVFQFLFDPDTGRLSPNSPGQFRPSEPVGPRHLSFHPNGRYVYFANEQGSSLTVCGFDGQRGILSHVQTASTLPAGFSGNNTCSQIHMRPDGRYVYVSNRGHDSIACFGIDAEAGRVNPVGHTATEKTPRAFNLDTTGKYLLVAGLDSGGLSTFAIGEETGVLDRIADYYVGKAPMWVLTIPA